MTSVADDRGDHDLAELGAGGGRGGCERSEDARHLRVPSKIEIRSWLLHTTLPRSRLHSICRIGHRWPNHAEPRAATSRPREATLTVEQLAYETGMSVRNIRNHQSRGLLPPPEVRARTGYYGPQHVARLRLIQEMQAEGFKLSAISRLIGEHGADADRFVGLRQAVTAPFATEAPEVLTRAELIERFQVDDDKLLGQSAEARPPRRPRRRALRSPEPGPAARRRGCAEDGDPAAGGPGRDREAEPQLRSRRPAPSSTSSSTNSGSPSTKPAAPTRAGPRSSSRSNACARSPSRPSTPPSA